MDCCDELVSKYFMRNKIDSKIRSETCCLKYNTASCAENHPKFF